MADSTDQPALPIPRPPLPSARKLLKQSFSFYFSHIGTFAGIAAIPALFVVFAIMLSGREIGASTLALLVVLVGLVITSVVAYLAFFDAVVERGEPQGGIAGAYRKGWHMLASFAWVSILLALSTWGGYVLLIIPGIMISIWLSLSTFVLFAEDRHGLEALTTSWHYVKHYWWSVFWRFLVAGVLSWLIGVIISWISFFGFQHGAVTTIPTGFSVQQLLLLVVNLFIGPIFGVVYPYFIYRSLQEAKASAPPEEDRPRLRKEIIAFIILGLVGIIGFLAIGGFLLLHFVGSPSLSAVFSGKGSLETMNYVHVFRRSPTGTDEPDAAIIQELSGDLNNPPLWNGSPTFLGPATSSLGSVSAILPPNYEATTYIFGEVIPESSEPMLLVEAMPTVKNLDDAAAQVKTLLAPYVKAGNSVEDTSTNFSNYPARILTISNQANLKFIVFQANTSIYLIGITYATALLPNAPNSAPAVLNVENQVIDKIVSSVKISLSAN